MRVVFLLLLNTLTLSSFGQEDFPKQLKAILADSSNGFKAFKGLFREIQAGDSTYHSLITVEGTSNNDIMFANSMDLYRAVVIDRIKEKKGEKIVEEWRQKIIAVLGGKFTEFKTEVVSHNPAKYGWSYSKGNVGVNITLYPGAYQSSLYWVCFGVTYFHGQNSPE